MSLNSTESSHHTVQTHLHTFCTSTACMFVILSCLIAYATVSPLATLTFHLAPLPHRIIVLSLSTSTLFAIMQLNK